MFSEAIRLCNNLIGTCLLAVFCVLHINWFKIFFLYSDKTLMPSFFNAFGKLYSQGAENRIWHQAIFCNIKILPSWGKESYRQLSSTLSLINWSSKKCTEGSRFVFHVFSWVGVQVVGFFPRPEVSKSTALANVHPTQPLPAQNLIKRRDSLRKTFSLIGEQLHSGSN